MKKACFIVEHPTRGVLVSGVSGRIRFSATVNRSDDRALKYDTATEANNAIHSLGVAGLFIVQMPEGIKINAPMGVPTSRKPAPRPDRRARKAELRKALIIALRELSEDEVINILTDNWATLSRLSRLDALKESFCP